MLFLGVRRTVLEERGKGIPQARQEGLGRHRARVREMEEACEEIKGRNATQRRRHEVHVQ